MIPTDFVYMQIYKGAIAAGSKEGIAKDAAVMGLSAYKKGSFKKVGALIKGSIASAVKVSKNAS